MSPVLPPPLISSPVLDFILSSQRLREALLPEGQSEPYEVLDYVGVLTLADKKGRKAVFERTQTVRFYQSGVGAILDHLWGDGFLISYDNSAGQIGDSIRDGARRHLVIDLPKQVKAGQLLNFSVKRTTLGGFYNSEEWLETVADHPIRHLSQSVLFPRERPPRCAYLESPTIKQPLPIVLLADGRSLVRIRVEEPRADVPYTITWSW